MNRHQAGLALVGVGARQGDQFGRIFANCLGDF
jgi:hypothetical protein